MAAVPSRGRAAPEADLTRALYERHAVQVFRYCLHQLGSREEAEDAVQSTFLNAFRGIKRGIVPEVEAAWLFKIAHNVCLSRRRSSWRRDRIESPAAFEAVEEVAAAPSRRADELIGLQDVLEQMPEQQRRAILLREWQGLSYREIGEELELSQAAVETLIFRARRSLAQGLEQPAQPRLRKRPAAGALGNLLASAQSFLLGGGGAVKVAAVVAVASAGTVAATAPTHHRAHAVAPAPAHVRRPVATVHPPVIQASVVHGAVHAATPERTVAAPSATASARERVASPRRHAPKRAYTPTSPRAMRAPAAHASHAPVAPAAAVTPKVHAAPPGRQKQVQPAPAPAERKPPGREKKAARIAAVVVPKEHGSGPAKRHVAATAVPPPAAAALPPAAAGEPVAADANPGNGKANGRAK